MLLPVKSRLGHRLDKTTGQKNTYTFQIMRSHLDQVIVVYEKNFRVLEENKEICSSRVLKILPSMITKCLNFTSDHDFRTLSTSVVGLAKDVRKWKINSSFVKEVDLINYPFNEKQKKALTGRILPCLL